MRRKHEKPVRVNVTIPFWLDQISEKLVTGGLYSSKSNVHEHALRELFKNESYLKEGEDHGS